MKQRNLLTAPNLAPNITRDTALAACWLAFGHKLDPHLPVVIYHERGQSPYLQFRVHCAGEDTTPLGLTQVWRESPTGLKEFERGLTTLLKKGDVQPGEVVKGQWAAYACFMRLVATAYKGLKRETNMAEAEIQSRRMEAIGIVLGQIGAITHGVLGQVDLWWSKPEGQLQFERWLGEFAKDLNKGHENEIWAMRLPAYVVAAREFFNHLDGLRVYINAAHEHKQELYKESRNGMIMEVSLYADPHRVRDLKREGGI